MKTLGAIASSLLLVVVLIFSLQDNLSDNSFASYLLPGRLRSDYSTAIGEHKVIVLSDQTRIHLNTFSAINEEYTKDQCTIYLLQGEIQLDVAKDTTRPLIVFGDQGSARALGAPFIVRNHGTSTELSVMESLVEVCSIIPQSLQA
jgi:ferric-dicitrate binding protein FerR (iron transport regulator)